MKTEKGEIILVPVLVTLTTRSILHYAETLEKTICVAVIKAVITRGDE